MSRTKDWLMDLEDQQQAEAAEPYLQTFPTTLFYRTTGEIAEEILKKGFVDYVVSPSPLRIVGVFLLDRGDAPGPGEAILKVELPISTADLQAFRLFAKFPGYCLPSELLNRRARISRYAYQADDASPDAE